MKKLFTLLLVLVLGLSLCACSNKQEDNQDDVPTIEVDYNAKSEGVMTYDEYATAADDNTVKVTVEGYVQASQSYWEGATMYLADEDGAYFLYGANISEEDWAKLGLSNDFSNGWTGLANGIKVKATGYKTNWAGEVEIGDIEECVVVDDGLKYIAEAKDLTDKFDNTDELAKYANQKVLFKGLTVVGEPLYNWDGSGAAGSNSDVYIKVSNGTSTYDFTVESYLMYEGSDAYNTAIGLHDGDTVNIEGFLYWYDVPQVHITSITK